MEALLNKFITEHFAAYVTVVIIAVIAFALLVWKLSQLWYRFRHLPCDSHANTLEELKHQSINKENLPCKTHNEKIEKHGIAVKSLETSIEYLNKNLERINSQLSNTGVSLTQQHSPLSISDRGWEVVKLLGMDKMFENNWSRIKKLIDEGVTTKNAYDINEFCIKNAVVFPDQFLQQSEIDVLKNDAYKQGLTLMDYMKVIAVMARDRYFKENSINIEESKKEE